ncbi:Eukaryotic translation initiation factor 3 subunit G [Plasmodiophora brassicae]
MSSGSLVGGFNWADEAAADVLALESVLPASHEVYDPATGIRTVIEYHFNDKGQKVQTIRKFKKTTQTVKVNKNVERRKHLTEFGDAKGQTEAIRRNVTYFAIDEIVLDLSRKTETDEDVNDPLNKLSGKSIVICRLCGAVGDHWTLKCPKRETALGAGERPSPTAAGESASTPTGASTTGRYVPPANRPGASAAMRAGLDKDDLPTIRITNLSEDTTESDLSELLAPFGHVMRIRLAKDRVTMRSKGYAFISFTTHDSAQRAIDRLQGYGYDNLILRAEWSRSMQQLMREREEKEAAERQQQAERMGSR